MSGQQEGAVIRPWADDGAWTPEAIVRLRKRLGWSQERLAWTIGRTTSSVQKLELGLRTPNRQTRAALDALVLNVYERLA